MVSVWDFTFKPASCRVRSALVPSKVCARYCTVLAAAQASLLPSLFGLHFEAASEQALQLALNYLWGQRPGGA
jgi:hypothetical protein